jgi:hypothetical protein
VCKLFICVAITIFGELWNETPARFTLTTDVENINKRINFFKYYNKKLIDPGKFVPKCWFNDLTNVNIPQLAGVSLFNVIFVLKEKGEIILLLTVY